MASKSKKVTNLSKVDDKVKDVLATENLGAVDSIQEIQKANIKKNLDAEAQKLELIKRIKDKKAAESTYWIDRKIATLVSAKAKNESRGYLYHGVNAPGDGVSIKSKSKSRSNKKPNLLHKFVTYNTLFTLSGLTEEEVRNPRTYLDGPVHHVIARSAGIGEGTLGGGKFTQAHKDALKRKTESEGGSTTVKHESAEDVQRIKETIDDHVGSVNILERYHDIFFENVNILSTVGPNPERGLANFTKMEFELSEPFGITFIEKVRAATFQSGYLDYQAAPLLLTIDWKGWDDEGKELSIEKKHLQRKVPIIIAKVEFDANQAGAIYHVIAVPYTDMAFDDSYKFTRTQFDVATSDFDEWVKVVEKELKGQMEKEEKENIREFPDTYEFQIDEQVKKDAKKLLLAKESTETSQSVKDALEESQKESDNDKVDKLNKQTITVGTGQIEIETGGTVYEHKQKIEKRKKLKASETMIQPGTSVVKAFEDMIRGGLGFQELVINFWVTYLKLGDPNATKETAIEYLTNPNKTDELQKHLIKNPYVPWFKINSTVHTNQRVIDKYTKMHPKKIIYRAVPYKIHVLKLIESGMSLGIVDWSDHVNKEYSYIYTGDNIDIQNLRIYYKTAYYMRAVRGALAPQQEANIKKEEGKNVLEKVLKYFGKETKQPPDPLLKMRSYPSIIKGGTSVNGNFIFARAQEFYDYLINPEADMMRIELEILGDPAWLAQDMYVTLGENEQHSKKSQKNIQFGTDTVFSDEYQSFNVEQYMPMIKLNYRLPADIDETKGTMFSNGNRELADNLFFGGIYQVVRVDSKMDSGQFTQTLTCVRLNNQQGKGELAQALGKSTNEILKEKEEQNLKTKKEGEPMIWGEGGS